MASVALVGLWKFEVTLDELDDTGQLLLATGDRGRSGPRPHAGDGHLTPPPVSTNSPLSSRIVRRPEAVIGRVAA